MNDPKLLSKSKKKVVAKVLVDEELSYRDAGSILGLSKDTIARYIREETPENLRQFETRIKEAFTIRESIVAAKALARIDKQVTTAKISEALEVYKTMTGNNTEHPQINIFNMVEKDRQKYGR